MAAVIFKRTRSVQQHRAIPERPVEFQTADFSKLIQGLSKHEQISADSLMGTMPAVDTILKKGVLSKLTSSMQWKPMEVALTTSGIYLARPGDELVRDLIPLYEVTRVRKAKKVQTLANVVSETSADTASVQSSFRNRSFTSLVDIDQEIPTDMHVIQIRTAENGYNSGRTYTLNAKTEEECASWIKILCSASDKAILLKHAGPGFLQTTKYRLRKCYHSVPVQTFVALLIFCSFIANILQTEVLSGLNPASSEEQRYEALFFQFEVIFTVAFTFELIVNMLSHFFLPFFMVSYVKCLCYLQIRTTNANYPVLG